MQQKYKEKQSVVLTMDGMDILLMFPTAWTFVSCKIQTKQKLEFQLTLNE